MFPLTVKGSEVVAEGILEKLVTPEETWREILRKQAESKGETFDPKSVTGPKITWQIKGLGARWERFDEASVRAAINTATGRG